MQASRIPALVILTMCVFGATSYFQDGTWIFPFPIYEPAMFVAAVILFLSDRKKPDLAVYLTLSWAFLSMVTSQFVLEIFMSNQQLDSYFKSRTPDIFSGIFCFAFIAWGGVISARASSSLLKNLTISFFTVFAILYLLGVSPYLQHWLGLLNSQASAAFAETLVYYAAIPLIGGLTCLVVDREKLSPYLQITALFTFFYLTKYGTLLFFTR